MYLQLARLAVLTLTMKAIHSKMAERTSSTQILAPQIAARILKIANQRKRNHPDSDDEEPGAFVHSLRVHMTIGGTANDRYEDKEVFDSSEGVVLQNGGQKLESGLLGAITLAYAGRYCLHLQPDDIWLAVCQGVSAHLQAGKNAKKYRKRFVDHDGKKDIVVNVTAFLTRKKETYFLHLRALIHLVSPPSCKSSKRKVSVRFPSFSNSCLACSAC